MRRARATLVDKHDVALGVDLAEDGREPREIRTSRTAWPTGERKQGERVVRLLERGHDHEMHVDRGAGGVLPIKRNLKVAAHAVVAHRRAAARRKRCGRVRRNRS